MCAKINSLNEEEYKWEIQPSEIGGHRQSNFDFGFGVLKKKASLIVMISKVCSLILGNVIMTQLLFNLDNVHSLQLPKENLTYDR
ncbi:hypothetical protein VNO77_12551 [Canavalia gladiata]|uniref:Uncharacterized protein n=1 Tax=Canavalia gladiata TaxID=3824 RepID=A0AAN9M007_CANGL